MNAEQSRVDASQTRSAATGQVQVFVVFDVAHDGDLYERLLAHSELPGSTFEVMGGSESSSVSQIGRERSRQRMRGADQVIVICGEHAEASAHVHSELKIARDAGKPYFLVWGRRGVMCTKPVGAKPTEGMFSWTRQLLQDQIALNVRKTTTDPSDESLRRVKRSPGSGPVSTPSLGEVGANPVTASHAR